MSLAGIREMSTILTPPEERYPVLTYVGQHDDKQIAAALRRELLRDGQAFYIHNRVRSIDQAAARVQALVPEARVVVAHGQMPEEQLERTVEGFWNREYDILVCTTIVETGLDISNANTLIVERADTFGLSQLHQLRGRVGRSRERGYAYFLYPPEVPLTETAYDRLATIAQNNELGAGMAVAMKDLEIRGAGNVLGVEQSGHVAGVGFDLYVRLVGEAVEAYRAAADGKTVAAVEEPKDVRIDLPVDANLPAGLHRQRPAAAGGLSPAGIGRRPGRRRCGGRRARRPVRPAARTGAAAGVGGAVAVVGPRVRRHRDQRTVGGDAAGVAADVVGLRANAAEADVPERELPCHDVDGAGADSAVGQRGRRTPDTRPRADPDGGRFGIGPEWKTAGRC